MRFERVGADETCVRVALAGSLDTAGVGEVELAFTAAAVTPGRHVLVDLSGVDFVSSLGMGLLIRTTKACRARGRSVVYFGAPPRVMEGFERSLVTPVLALAPDAEAARAMLEASA
jgi:anti-anti-sigma factor